MKNKASLKKVSKLHNKCIILQQLNKIELIIYSIAFRCKWIIGLFQSPKGKKIAKDEDGKNNAAIGAAPTSATSNTENVHKPKEGMVRKMQSYLYLVEFDIYTVLGN